MNVLQSLLGQRLVGFLILVLVIAVILLAGVAFEWAPETRYLLALVVAVAFLGLFVWAQVRAARGASMLESALAPQLGAPAAGARPGDAERIADLKKRFEESLGLLRQSRLGRGAIYRLPWYVIIGPPGSGKTTMLRESGIDFPYMTRGRAEIHGLGGTKNCDWWFADRGVLLDTAGRFVTEFEDRSEWLEFLKLLKRSRKQKPINGAIVAVSLEDVAHKSEAELRKIADDVRDRIGELTQHLQVVFPVSLVFTKCDLLLGFVEFFERLDQKERKQIWGFTFPFERPADFDFAQRFAAEFDLLYDQLGRRRLEQLAGESTRKKKQLVYRLPQQFLAVKDRVCQFVDLLQQQNPYREVSQIRGCYFTSGTQERSVLSEVMERMAADMGIDAQELDIPEGERKCYFVDDVFDKVLFEESDLVRPTDEPKRHLWYVGSLAAMALAALVSIVLVWNNYSAAAAQADHVVSYFEAARRADGEPFVERVRILDNLQRAVDTAAKRELDGLDALEAELKRRLELDLVQPVDAALLAEMRADLEACELPAELAGPEAAALRALPAAVAAFRKRVGEAQQRNAQRLEVLRAMRSGGTTAGAAAEEALRRFDAVAGAELSGDALLRDRARDLFRGVLEARHEFPMPEAPPVEADRRLQERAEVLAAWLGGVNDFATLRSVFGPQDPRDRDLGPAELCSGPPPIAWVAGDGARLSSVFVSATKFQDTSGDGPTVRGADEYLGQAAALRDGIGQAGVGERLSAAAAAAHQRFENGYRRARLDAWGRLLTRVELQSGLATLASIEDGLEPVFRDAAELIADALGSLGVASAPTRSLDALRRALRWPASPELGVRAEELAAFVTAAEAAADQARGRWSTDLRGDNDLVQLMTGFEARIVEQLALRAHSAVRSEIDDAFTQVDQDYTRFAAKFPFADVLDAVDSKAFLAWVGQLQQLARAANVLGAVSIRRVDGEPYRTPVADQEFVDRVAALAGCFQTHAGTPGLDLFFRVDSGVLSYEIKWGGTIIDQDPNPNNPDRSKAMSWQLLGDEPLSIQVRTVQGARSLRDVGGERASWPRLASDAMPASFWNLFRICRMAGKNRVNDPQQNLGAGTTSYDISFKPVGALSLRIRVPADTQQLDVLHDPEAFRLAFPDQLWSRP
ncbi:MAG: type VI secretion system membrane subunit TssM [Planctomycetota bacterium]